MFFCVFLLEIYGCCKKLWLWMNVKYMHYLLDGCSIIVFSDEPKYHNMIAMSLAMSSTIQVFCDKTLCHNLFDTSSTTPWQNLLSQSYCHISIHVSLFMTHISVITYCHVTYQVISPRGNRSSTTLNDVFPSSMTMWSVIDLMTKMCGRH